MEKNITKMEIGDAEERIRQIVARSYFTSMRLGECSFTQEIYKDDENTMLPQKEENRINTTTDEDNIFTDFPSRVKTKSKYRICKNCGLPFTPPSFGERAKFGILGNMALPGLGFFLKHKMKKYCHLCR